ncbi:leucine-rich repeat protein [Porcipelethomonas sp.]|uniref:leucine-rich repeat domain-containing protein n=1 Tax=Porcipelethomonas sp. TaxID=2981675 RepID=UPI003EF81279
MIFKKIAMILTASALILSSAVSFSVCAEYTDDEDTVYEDDVSSGEEEESTITSEDGTYEYTVAENDDGSQYAVLETYLGNDTDVEIPSEIDGIKVQEIGDYTYYEKDNIKTIFVPASVEDFGLFSFYGCTSLTEFKVDDNNEIYKAVDGILFGKDDLVIFCCPPGKKLTSYTVPDTVVAIASSAFAVCQELESIELPDSLKYIKLYAFSECTKLDNVVIPEGVEELEDFTFSGCTSLSDITLPEGLTKIDGAVFYSCESLCNIEFPESLYSIGQGAFVSTGFDSIEIPETIIEIGYSAFGFYTDQAGEITPMDDFTVYGYEGSYAQTYCNENEVTFVAKEETVQEEESGIKPGIIVGICIAAVIIIAIVIIIVYKFKNTDYDDDDRDIGDYEDYDDDDNNDDSREAEDDPESSNNENEENNDEA